MNGRRRKRQVLLFLGAILIPAVLLVGLAVRVYRQDGELTEKRNADARRFAVEQLQRELVARLETIKLQAISSIIGNWPVHGNSPVVLVAFVRQGQMRLPWSIGVTVPARTIVD